ncbi:MAG TPA: hypothetical protein VE863_09025 [Pyrinomonadaceae bacterium]|jgi:hypothetical protein|nr:hypothetical protein [Pyrinomonadaceae bacterium]
MVGLRVFTNCSTIESHGGRGVFYSRRDDGPYYRWSYYENRDEWQAGRVLPSRISQRELLMMTWKTVPERLQRSIIEHYED